MITCSLLITTKNNSLLWDIKNDAVDNKLVSGHYSAKNTLPLEWCKLVAWWVPRFLDSQLAWSWQIQDSKIKTYKNLQLLPQSYYYSTPLMVNTVHDSTLEKKKSSWRHREGGYMLTLMFLWWQFLMRLWTSLHMFWWGADVIADHKLQSHSSSYSYTKEIMGGDCYLLCTLAWPLCNHMHALYTSIIRNMQCQ